MSQDRGFPPSCCRPAPEITKLYDTKTLILVRKRLILMFLTGGSDIRNGIYVTPHVAGCGFCPSSCRPTLKITKLYDTRMLILVRKRLISVFLSGKSDIRNGIYGRPTTQQFARTHQQFSRTHQQFAWTHQQFARTRQQFERTHQQLAINRGRPCQNFQNARNKRSRCPKPHAQPSYFIL